MSEHARIVLIHATPLAIEPVHAVFAADWQKAEIVNLLDDSLSVDRAAAGALTPLLVERIGSLARYGLVIGADGILFTCSAFGEAIELAAEDSPVPVLKPNEAMFEQALRRGRRIGMLATFEPSVEALEEEFALLSVERGRPAEIETICVPEAMAALQAGDAAAHNRLLAEAAPRLAECDAVMLAQFSTSRAREAVRAVLSCPVLTSPGSAVAKLKAVLAGQA